MADKKLTELQQMIQDGVAPIRHIPHPDAQLLRQSEVSAVKGGKPDSGCPHPQHAVQQYVDDPKSGRPEVPINLYKCTVCGSLLWVVDAHGRAASDR